MDTPNKIEGYLKIPDITGHSERTGHEDEIIVYGIDFDIKAPYEPGTLARLGKVSLSTVKFTKNYDKSSPLLKMAVYKNKKLDEVVFTAIRTVEEKEREYLKITLREAFVMKYIMRPSPHQNGGIEDFVEFSYKEIEVEYDGADPQVMNVATSA